MTPRTLARVGVVQAWRRRRAAAPVAALLDDDAVAAYHRDGFVGGGRLLSDAEADDLFARIEALAVPGDDEPSVAYDMGVGGAPLLHLKDVWRIDGAVRDLIDHPALATALERLLGGDRFVLWQDAFFYKPGLVGSSHAWHQDLVYIPLRGCRAVAAWVALTEVDAEEAGAMTMVPGSHRWGDASAVVEALGEPREQPLPTTHRGEPVREEVCLVPKGSVHFHDGLAWHGSLANQRPGPRCGLLFLFVSGEAELDPEHPSAHRYPEVAAGGLDPDLHPVVQIAHPSA